MKQIKVTIITDTIKTAMTFPTFEEAFNYSQKMLSACKYNGTKGVAYFEDVE